MEKARFVLLIICSVVLFQAIPFSRGARLKSRGRIFKMWLLKMCLWHFIGNIQWTHAVATCAGLPKHKRTGSLLFLLLKHYRKIIVKYITIFNFYQQERFLLRNRSTTSSREAATNFKLKLKTKAFQNRQLRR